MDMHSVFEALTLIGIFGGTYQVEDGEQRKRRVSDIGWGGWAILAAIIAPAMGGAFLAGQAVNSINNLDLRLTHELEVRDLKINHIYDQLILGAFLTEDEGDRLERMILDSQARCRAHIEAAGPLIQKLDILWARSDLEHAFHNSINLLQPGAGGN